MQGETVIPQTKDINHPIYARVEDPKDADALAWVFKNKDEFVPYYFKLPEIKDDEVRAKVLYTGLCHSDIMTGREYWGPAKFPVCTGHEIIGRVEKVGSAVTDFKPGDIVGLGPFRTSCFHCGQCNEGADNICKDIDITDRFIYGTYFGGYCTHIQQPATHTFHIPQGMDLANIPPILCAGVTVFAPMKRHITKPGAKVAVIGIGGLGHLAVQYGKAMGCEVTGFTSDPEKVEYIKKLGAAHVIVVDKEFKELKKHEKEFDYLVNTLPISNRNIMESYVSTLTNGGTMIVVGIPNLEEPLVLGFFSLVARQITLAGSIVASVQETKDTIEFTHKHGIRVETENFSFEDFPKALNRLEHGKPHFRCVVNVEDFNKKHFPN